MDKFEELDGMAVNPSTEPAIGEVISRRSHAEGNGGEQRVRAVRLRNDERCQQL